jgi:hypothetical protein
MAEEENPTPLSQPEPPQEVPEEQPKPETHKEDQGRLDRFKSWYTERKKWTIPASVVLFILLLVAIPFTRYAIAGLFVKQDYSVKIVDSAAGTPVSGATVSAGSISAETDGTGKATLHQMKPGPHQVTLTKKYYKDGTAKVTVAVTSQKSTPALKMTATGRQVKISVVNLVNKQKLSGVEIKVADTTAKTDKDGTALVVLPVGVSDQKATLSLSGYNDASVTVKVSNDKVQENDFTLTPAGKVYFLSKLSGKIDVVKTNLDGTARQTVLAGTGHEEDGNTVLLASRDWKYLALLSRRAGSSPSLYLIDTSNDSLSTIDEGNASFSLNGWVNDDFVYTVTRNDVQLWQANRQALKSFSAASKKITVLDQTSASGTGSFDYATELLGDVYGYDSQVYYIINWSGGINAAAAISAKQATFNSIKPDGSAKKAIKSFGLAPGTTAIDVSLDQRVEQPDKINLHFSDGTKDNFYTYSNGQVKDNSSLTTDTFYSTTYPTYLESPSGSSTFWSESRDGKNTLFLGDSDGENGKQIATLSPYATYGWYTDNYLFVSKDSSELYIMAKSGSQAPIKISDYHKPAYTFQGYGGGYGGL